MWNEMNKLGFPAPKLIKLCKFEIMKYMLRLQLVNIHPLNLNLTNL